MIDLKTNSEVHVTQLVTGIMTDVQKLIKQHLALLRHEVRDDLHKTKEASLSLIWGSVIALIGGILLAFMLVELLSWAAPKLPLWASYAIVGAPIAVLGGTLFIVGIQKFKSLSLLPDQSARALKETFQWQTNPK